MWVFNDWQWNCSSLNSGGLNTLDLLNFAITWEIVK
jgi:hypothetical protein